MREFAIQYTEDFTEDIYDHLVNWCNENLVKGDKRWFDMNYRKYDAFKENKYYFWIGPLTDGNYICGVGSSSQSNSSISLFELCEMIGYNKKMTDDELIEEAKKIYPVGSVFDSTNIGCNCSYKIKDHTGFYTSNGDLLVKYTSTTGGSPYTLYRNGKWAEIVSLPEPKYVAGIDPVESNLEKANRMFKVGMTIKTPSFGSRKTLTGSHFPFKVDIDGDIYTKGGQLELYNSKRDKWATIESTPQEYNVHHLTPCSTMYIPIKENTSELIDINFDIPIVIGE